jgi:exopolyphosphatase/guanosine-5'-triphosphate,3'-diphosphate pyrophosphatase
VICGIIDIGSNTIRLSIFEVREGRSFKQLVSKKIVAGLATYLSDGRLSDKGAAKLLKCLREFMAICEGLNVLMVHAFATASLRYADNASAVTERVLDDLGLRIDLVSGEEEARLSYLGARHSTGIENGLVADIGGASCEIIRVCAGNPVAMLSLPVGCLSLSLECSPGIFPDDGQAASMAAAVKERLEAARGIFDADASGQQELAFVGGSARGVYRSARELAAGNDRLLAAKDIEAIIEGMANRRQEVIQAVRSAAPDRIFTLLAGAMIMREIVSRSGARLSSISKCGVREGYLFDRVMPGIGANGANGMNGANGANGMSGVNGANGANGMSGMNGANGANGANGGGGSGA